MGKTRAIENISYIENRLTGLSLRVRALEEAVVEIQSQSDNDTKNVWTHTCRFMPPGFRIKNTAEDFNDWRIINGLDLWSPRLNFCPYCGVQLCEPEIP